MAHPDIPRWVSLRRVDSQAMLSAFLNHMEERTTDEMMEVVEVSGTDHA